MIALLLSWLAPVAPYLLGLVAAAGALFFSHKAGQAKGEASANAENTKTNLEQKIARVEAESAAKDKVIQNANDVAAKTASIDDAAVDSQLQDKWNG